jgi:hypothetical protein
MSGEQTKALELEVVPFDEEILIELRLINVTEDPTKIGPSKNIIIGIIILQCKNTIKMLFLNPGNVTYGSRNQNENSNVKIVLS